MLVRPPDVLCHSNKSHLMASQKVLRSTTASRITVIGIPGGLRSKLCAAFAGLRCTLRARKPCRRCAALMKPWWSCPARAHPTPGVGRGEPEQQSALYVTSSLDPYRQYSFAWSMPCNACLQSYHVQVAKECNSRSPASCCMLACILEAMTCMGLADEQCCCRTRPFQERRWRGALRRRSEAVRPLQAEWILVQKMHMRQSMPAEKALTRYPQTQQV